MHHRTLDVGYTISRAVAALLAAASLAALPTTSRAIITYNNPSGNTTAPAGDQGWSYVGSFAGSSGVAIGSSAFLATVHQGGSVGDLFNLNGTDYTTTSVDTIPGTDLRVWHVSGTLNAQAQLYTGNPVGQAFTDTAYGVHTLGPAVDAISGSPFNGWQWGTTPGKSWGTNSVESTAIVNGFHEIAFDFDPVADQGVIADRDSGGGVFINDGGVWKLAGINYAVEGPYSLSADGNSPFFGAIYDGTNLFEETSTNPVTFGPADPGPQFAFAHDVSFYAPEIEALVPEPRCAALLLAPALLALTRRARSR